MADEPAALLSKEMAATFFPEKTKEKGGEGRHPHRSKSFSGEFFRGMLLSQERSADNV